MQIKTIQHIVRDVKWAVYKKSTICERKKKKIIYWDCQDYSFVPSQGAVWNFCRPLDDVI